LRFSLQTKTLLIVLTVVGLYAGLDYTSQRLFVLPSFVSLEHSQAQNTMRRCVVVLKRQISDLDETAKDWAASDGTLAPKSSDAKDKINCSANRSRGLRNSYTCFLPP
jgi:sensor domain CHASE-containing protein